MTEHSNNSGENRRAVRRGNPRIALVAIVPALLIAGAVLRRGASPTEKAAEAESEETTAPAVVEVATAVLRPMETVVAAQGILTPAQGASARVSVVSAGRLTKVLVREGERVAAGQLLAVVDNQSAVAGQRSAAAALSASLSDARQAELATRATQNDQTNALRQARLALQSTLSERYGAINQAQLALRGAESELRKIQIVSRAPDVGNALQQARLALDAARLDREAAIKAARNAVQAAQTDLEKLQAGARPQEIAQAEQTVSQTQATRDRAATEVERVQFLFDKGIKARRELEDAKTALRVAESSLQSAQDALSLLRAGAPRQDIQAAELRLSGAREALDAAQKSNDAKVLQAQSAVQLARGNVGQAAQQRPEDVRAATLKVAAARDALRQVQQSGDAKVTSARALLQAASQGGLQVAAKAEDARAKQALVSGKQADLSGARIATALSELRASLSGIITRRNLNVGDLADPATPVLEITDANALNLLANLPSENGIALRAGQSAHVTAESAPGRVFPAQVVSVGQIDPQSGLMAVRVAVSNPGHALRIGALASCDIVLSRRPLAVAVPRQAVITRDGKPVVFTMSDGKAHQHEVKTGVENGALMEIRSGVKPGERVIRLGQYELEDDAAVREAGGGRQ